MATVIDIINLALKDIGVAGEGMTASADTINDSFATLKQMLAVWQTENMYVYAQKEISFPVTGAQSYAVGLGSAVNIVRPKQIIGGFLRVAGQDQPIDVLTSFLDYERIRQKGEVGQACAIYYLPAFPIATLYVYPAPSAGTLHLVVNTELPAYATIASDLALPDEYAGAIRYSLAEMLATSFQAPIRPDVTRLAARLRKMVKRNNIAIPNMQFPDVVLPQRGYFQIEGY